MYGACCGWDLIGKKLTHIKDLSYFSESIGLARTTSIVSKERLTVETGIVQFRTFGISKMNTFIDFVESLWEKIRIQAGMIFAYPIL